MFMGSVLSPMVFLLLFSLVRFPSFAFVIVGVSVVVTPVVFVVVRGCSCSSGVLRIGVCCLLVLWGMLLWRVVVAAVVFAGAGGIIDGGASGIDVVFGVVVLCALFVLSLCVVVCAMCCVIYRMPLSCVMWCWSQCLPFVFGGFCLLWVVCCAFCCVLFGMWCLLFVACCFCLSCMSLDVADAVARVGVVVLGDVFVAVVFVVVVGCGAHVVVVAIAPGIGVVVVAVGGGAIHVVIDVDWFLCWLLVVALMLLLLLVAVADAAVLVLVLVMVVVFLL